MPTPRPRLVSLLLLAILFAWGCSRGGAGKLIPVSGKVTVEGKALTRGSVSFRPDKARGSTGVAEPYGDIDSTGTYTLFTAQKPGAPAGKYLVLVTATEEVDPKNASATPKSLINEKYSDPDKLLIQVEVEENAKSGQYDLKLAK